MNAPRTTTRALRTSLTAVAALAMAWWAPGMAQANPGNWQLHTPYASNMCLDADYVAGSQTQNPWRNGDKVQMWVCNDQAQQGWLFHPVSTPSGVPAFTITNQRSGLCLDMDISGGTHDNIPNDYLGHLVQLWHCLNDSSGHPVPNQVWYQLSGDHDGWARLQSGADTGGTFNFMDAKNYGGTDPSQNGDPVLVWDYIPGDSPQNWNWT
ncbi:RICIN domain-containing protein [Streptomyces rubellomurinus]|uniref:Ricin B lectin domain-containing protein n=1 Tax=Streptomyces rubellomurinus (strain ATCC 31215) TaxID=359131 RepID=A0A0F2TF12_STRR3|nr:RICIN domain-containing protein [Streptomyces rubellomurinus]KJS61724.1 hypothetical protein VM95_13515 [Streptomyces rubellomurinus]